MPSARWLCGSLLLIAAAACQPAPAASPLSPVVSSAPTPSQVPASAPAEAPVVTVSVAGGECPNGPCGAEYVLYSSGRIDGPEGGPASVPPARVAAIASLAAATDWDAVRSVPFTGECPTAFDGQKHVYAFPADAGELVFDSCEFDLAAVPVFQAIDAALFGG